MDNEHIGCGGNLAFEKNTVEHKVIGMDRDHKPIIKSIHKTLYRCNKCNQLINCIVFPSYEEYVLRGIIRVSQTELWRVRNRQV
jgi:hypothetical protein